MGSSSDLLTLARSQLGTHEDPPSSNRVKYTDWFGMGPVAWCDIFVSWCAFFSGNGAEVGRFAYTPSHEAWFRSKGQWFDQRQAQVGDIVFFNFIGRTSHVGMVEAVRADGLVTIEGNTNGGGSRDGGSVMRHFRAWSREIVGVGRPAYTGQPTGDAVADLMEQFKQELVNQDERAKAREARDLKIVTDRLDQLDDKIGEAKRMVRAVGKHSGMSDAELTAAAKPA